MTRTHEIKLDGYGAHTTLADDRPVMLLGTAESYGIETLHVVSGKSWEGLTITATFNAPDGTSTDMLMNADGSITVPSEATGKSGSGKIVFTGVSDGIQRISCDLDYFVVAHSAINGAQSGGVAPSWFEQAANRFMPLGGATGQVLTKKTDADFDAEWQDSKGGGTTDHSQLINRSIADQHPISAITGLEEALANKQPSGEYLTQEDLQAATDTALAQAKASGEFDGKSAYAYAQDGGYTGTEAEFAAKLAKEKFANPYALTFTGAVEGSYDGSAPVSVEIPSGGSGSSDAWNLIEHITAEDAAISYEIPLQPGAKEYGIYWRYTNNDIPRRDINVDESLAHGFGLMFRCMTNEDLFLRVYKGPSNILVTSQSVYYMASRFNNGGTFIGSGTDFPAMTLTTNIACTTSEIWVYWR